MAGRTRQPRSVLERGLMTPEQAQEALEKWESGVFDYRTVKQALRTIASMHYEYAVQNVETGMWLREDVNGLILYMKNPLVADWGTDREEAEKYAAWIAGETLAEHRVVRRLVSAPEVVE